MTKPIMIDMRDRCCGTVTGLWQYDYGRVLKIQDDGMPTAVEIHFSLQENGGNAVPRVGTTRDGVTEVVIPDSMLENEVIEETGYQIHAFIYLVDNTSGQTTKKIDMLVRTRPRPEAFDTPEEAELFRETIVAVNEAADRAEAAEDSASGHAQSAEQSASAATESSTQAAGYAGDAAGYAGMAKASADAAAQSLTDATMQADSARAAAAGAAGSEAAAESFADTAGQIMADTEAKGQQIVADATAQADRAAAQATAAKVSAEAAAKTLADTKTEGAKIVDDATTQADNAKQSAAEADTDQKQVAADKTTVETLAKQVQELTAQVRTLTAKAEGYAEAAKRNEQADLAVNDPEDPAYVKNRTHWEELGPSVNTLEWDGALGDRYYSELMAGDSETAQICIVQLTDYAPTMDQLNGAQLTYRMDGSNAAEKTITLVAGENLVDAAGQYGVAGCYVHLGAMCEIYFFQEDCTIGTNTVKKGTSSWVLNYPNSTMPSCHLMSLTGENLEFKGPDIVHMIAPKYYERLAWVEEGAGLMPLDLTNDPEKALSVVVADDGVQLLRVSDKVLTLDELLQCHGHVKNGDDYEQTMSLADAYAAGMVTEAPGLISAMDMMFIVSDVESANGLGLPFTVDHVGIYVVYMEGMTLRLYSDTVMVEGGDLIHKIDNKFIDADWMAKGGQDQYEGEILAEINYNAGNVGGGIDYSVSKTAVNYDKVNEGDGVVVMWDGKEYPLEVKFCGGGGLQFLYAGNFGGAMSGAFSIPNTGEPFVVTFGVTDIDTREFVRDCTVSVADESAANMAHTVSIYAKSLVEKLPNRYLNTDYINSLIDEKLGVIENGYY